MHSIHPWINLQAKIAGIYALAKLLADPDPRVSILFPGDYPEWTVTVTYANGRSFSQTSPVPDEAFDGLATQIKQAIKDS